MLGTIQATTPDSFTGTVRRLGNNRQYRRVLLYAMLLLCDVAAIRGGFSLGVSLRGRAWMSPNGVELGWLVLPTHILIGLRNGAYSTTAVESRLESIRRGTSAFVIAASLVCMLMFFQAAGPFVSRVAFGAALLISLAGIGLIRAGFISLFVSNQGGWMIGELLVVDGSPVPPTYKGDVFDAKAAEFIPDITDPQRLARLADVFRDYDRVVVSCASKQRRSDWAVMLKSFAITGEVLLDEGSPLGAIGVERFRGRDTVIVSRGPLSLGNRFMKRTMDISLSLLGLIFLAPLLIVVAVAIRLDSSGPVFFSQPRVGKGNRMFQIMKFRSMHADMSDLAGNRSTGRKDDRVTRLGALIRKTSIDELPQLFNVLFGQMSMVGPRPHALGSLAGDKLFWEIDGSYWRRHALKPGITGLAQVRGFRGATHQQADLENRLQADLEYVSGWSLWRDFKILFATLGVLVHSQAY